MNVITLLGLVVIGMVVVKIMFLIYHVVSFDHMFKVLYNFLGGNFL